MKRRLISFASALVLSLTAFASLSVSADATVPTIKAEILDSDGNVITDASTLKVDDTFTVQYSYDGFNDLTAYVAGRTKTGTVLNAIQFMANIPCDDENLYWESWTSSDMTNAGTAQINEDYDNGRLVYVVAFSDPAKAPATPSGVLGSITVTVKAPITKDWKFDFDETYDTSVFVNKIVKGVDNVTLYKFGAETNSVVFAPATLSAGSTEKPVESIALDKDSISLDLHENKTATLTATVLPTDATDPTVTWSVDNADVATVENGTVTAVGFGTATIKATAGDKTATCTVTVKAVAGDEIKSTDDTKTIKVLDIPTVNFANHGQFIYITKGEETRKSAQTIGEILGGEWIEGTKVEGTVAIGILTADSADAFSFEIK